MEKIHTIDIVGLSSDSFNKTEDNTLQSDWDELVQWSRIAHWVLCSGLLKKYYRYL